MKIGIDYYIFGTIITILILYFGNAIWKNNIKKKIYFIVKEKYELYRHQGCVFFDVTHPLMIGKINIEEYCNIKKNSFTIKGQKYNITDELCIKYSLSSLSKSSNAIYVYINQEKYIFRSINIPLKNILAFLVIIYLIQNKVEIITPEIVDKIVNCLEY